MTERRSSAQLAADAIRTGIMDGSYAAGQRLVEFDLAHALGASRAHVREALRQLRAEGLVDIAPNRGAAVKRVTREDIYLAGRVREALEGTAARQLAERGPDAQQREALLKLRARLTRSAEMRDLDDYQAANEALHSFIVDESGNPYLVEFLGRLRLLVRQTQHIQASRPQELFDGNVEHLAIIDAILLNHPDVAENMMRMHVRKGTQMTDDWLRQQGAQ